MIGNVEHRCLHCMIRLAPARRHCSPTEEKDLSANNVFEQTKHNPPRLRGQLGLVAIVFMVVAGAAPLTVVGGPVPIAFALGNGAGVPSMFVLTGIVLVLFAVGFTAMSRFVPSAGGFYSFAFIGLGRRIGMGTGYAALLSYLSLYIGMFGLMGPAINSLVLSFGGPSLPWWSWSVLALLVTSIVGYRNIDLSGKVLGVLLIAEVAIVIGLNAAILFTGAHGHGLSTGFADPSTVTSGAPGVAFLFAILGFIGVEATVVFRDEARVPDKTIPRATYVAVIFIAVFYALTSWLMVSGVGDAKIVSMSASTPDNVLPWLAEQYLGKTGADIIRVLFVSSIFACILTFHNVVSRYVFSLANRELLPKRLGDIHPRHGSPRTASLVVSIVTAASIALAVLVGLDAVGEFYTWLVGLASLGYVVLLVVTTIAVIVFFARRPDIRLGIARTRVAPVLALVGLVVTLALIIANLMALVGGNVAVTIVVIALVVAAFALGPIVGALRPRSGWEVDATLNELSPVAESVGDTQANLNSNLSR